MFPSYVGGRCGCNRFCCEFHPCHHSSHYICTDFAHYHKTISYVFLQHTLWKCNSKGNIYRKLSRKLKKIHNYFKADLLLTHKYQYLEPNAVNCTDWTHDENGEEGMNEAFGSCISKHLKLHNLMFTVERCDTERAREFRTGGALLKLFKHHIYFSNCFVFQRNDKCNAWGEFSTVQFADCRTDGCFWMLFSPSGKICRENKKSDSARKVGTFFHCVIK